MAGVDAGADDGAAVELVVGVGEELDVGDWVVVTVVV